MDRLPGTSSGEAISKMEQQFGRYGIPDQMVTDNGPQFTSDEFTHFTEVWDIEHITSSPHHSQSNGKVESVVKIFKNIVRKALRDDIDMHLAILEWQNTPTSGMDSSPAQRLMSCRTRTTLPTKSTLTNYL